MGHLFFEHFLLLLGVFIIGLILGVVAKLLLRRKARVGQSAVSIAEPDLVAVEDDEAIHELEELEIETTAFGLEEPRGGIADDLTRISGIGPKINGLLNELGVFHFDQIAGWNSAEITGVDEILNFKGRIIREDWVGQAKALVSEG